MVQMYVCLWQVDQQAHHPLVFYLGAREAPRSLLTWWKLLLLQHDNDPWGSTPQRSDFLPLVYLLIDLGLLPPPTVIF